MPTVNEIVREFGVEYTRLYEYALLPSHQKALKAIHACRTEQMGSHQQICDQCGYEHRIFHSCKNRSCPQCYFKRTQQWLKVQEQRLLPVHYFHLVFTLPSQLRMIIRRHQKALYPVLFHAATESLQALAADKRYVGGKLGITAVLHTWSGAMNYHPHLHCLVPGVGINAKGDVLLSREKFLVPVKALSAKFRGRFLELARKAVPEENFSVGGNVKKWVVFSKPVKNKNAQKVLQYLGRYLHRMAISNSSILKVENNSVLFRYKKTTDKNGRGKWAVMKLDPKEFLRRFLQHVLPKGLAKVRHYGFLAPAAKNKLDQVSRTLKLSAYLKQQEIPIVEQKEETNIFDPCPICGCTNWKTPWNREAPKVKQVTMPP